MRLFVALQPPEAIVQALEHVALGAAQRFGGRASRPETLHLTLAFLGAVAPEALSAVDAACRVAAGDACLAGGFVLQLDGLACWGHKRLIWAGCGTIPGALPELADALRARLELAGLAVAGEHAFTPHLTLVRRVGTRVPASAEACAQLLAEICPAGLPAWPVRELVLVESHLHAGGPEHRVLATYPLGGEASAASCS